MRRNPHQKLGLWFFFCGMPVAGHGKVCWGSFFIVDAKRQIWLTMKSTSQLEPISKDSLILARSSLCTERVVLEATCTYSGNEQKVRHFRKCFDFVCWIELWKLHRVRGSSVPCYASNQRVHCSLGLPNETTSSATEPACSSDLRA